MGKPDTTPCPTGCCDRQYGLTGNRHLRNLMESIFTNTGELVRNVKESESWERKNLEYSDVLTGSQIGHSTLSTGKLCTWGRAEVL